MSDRLSRDEVDALLKGMEEGEVAVAAPAAPSGRVVPYELVRERRLADADAATLGLVHDRLAKELAKRLETIVGASPTVECGERAVLPFGTVRNRIPRGACLCWFVLSTGEGRGLLVLPAELSFELVDRVFGGPGRVPPNAADRTYSPIETHTLRRFAARALEALTAACAPVASLDPSLLRTGDTAALLALADSEEPMLVLEATCDLGSGASPIRFALPRVAIASLCGADDGAPPAAAGAPADWARAMRAAVYRAEVSISAELGRRDLRAQEVLRLRVGDVIALPTRGDDPLVVRVEGRGLLRGLAGVSRGQNAIRILGFEGGE
ncbi:MAG TPA: FliM/FliN family flagellar motor switch protein [Candidatus Binatia bacterium]|nr:FliM/FliN family flagellar motor switch protein [Candidatus Binatia bacterium]